MGWDQRDRLGRQPGVTPPWIRGYRPAGTAVGRPRLRSRRRSRRRSRTQIATQISSSHESATKYTSRASERARRMDTCVQTESSKKGDTGGAAATRAHRRQKVHAIKLLSTKKQRRLRSGKWRRGGGALPAPGVCAIRAAATRIPHLRCALKFGLSYKMKLYQNKNS